MTTDTPTLAAELERMIELRKKAKPGEWFVGVDIDEGGLCLVDDGRHGHDSLFPISCEWHEGRFIADVANFFAQGGPAEQILEMLKEIAHAIPDPE